MCVVGGGEEVDLRLAARASGNKSASMLPMKELQPLTGYMRGGCTPVGMRRRLPVYYDEGILRHERVYVSAGMRGMQMLLCPADLIAYTDGTVAPLIRR